MVDKCDICGFEIEPNARYCGGCNVDLREPKGHDEPVMNLKKVKSTKTDEKRSSKKKDLDDENVMKWCTVRSLCDSFEMTFPIFFFLVIMLASGNKKLGFCDCPTCNQGYRELLASTTSVTENKKLTAQSREIVIKAREKKIAGISFDIPDFVEVIKKKDGQSPVSEAKESTQRPSASGKITIEIDPVVLENAVFNVLKSERGREIIQSVPRKYIRTKAASKEKKRKKT